MKHKTLVIFALLVLSCSIVPTGVYAEEEEDEDEDREGFGIQEREREREHQEDSSPFPGAILYVTIGAIVAAIGYTAFKLARSKATAKLR
jgi:cytochrome b